MIDRDEHTNGTAHASGPSTNGGDDGYRRNAAGQFGQGNKGGNGNPFGAKAASLRAKLFDSVSEHDMAEMVEAMITQAKRGNVAAFHELSLWVVGKPDAFDLINRIGELEDLIRQLRAKQGQPLTKVA